MKTIVSKATLRYAQALIDPWSFIGNGLTVPDVPVGDLATDYAPIKTHLSMPYTTVQPYTLICVDPYRMIYGSGTNTPIAIYDLATPNQLPSAAASSQLLFASGTIAEASVGTGANQLVYRPVACGIRVQDYTPVLSRASITTRLKTPWNTGEDLSLNLAEQNPSAGRSVNPDRTECVYYPAKEEDLAYRNGFPIAPVAGGPNGCLFVYISAPVGSMFYFSIAGLGQVQGQLSASYSKVPAHNDPQGHSAIQQAVQNEFQYMFNKPRPSHHSVLSKIGHFLGKMVGAAVHDTEKVLDFGGKVLDFGGKFLDSGGRSSSGFDPSTLPNVPTHKPGEFDLGDFLDDAPEMLALAI
jgi:hypothetical protein